MVFNGSVTVSASNPANNYQGVTEITGTLTLANADGIEAFACLEIAGGGLTVNGGTMPTGAGPPSVFPNLRTSLGVAFRIFSSGTLAMDCALRSLESIPGGYLDVLGGETGELNVSKVVGLQYVLISGTSLRRLVLPSNMAVRIGQLSIDRHPMLTEIAGFENVTLTPGTVDYGTYYSLRASGNPLLSSCRAQQLQQLFLGAGYPASSIIITGNGPACP